jgi:hypothetical protein
VKSGRARQFILAQQRAYTTSCPCETTLPLISRKLATQDTAKKQSVQQLPANGLTWIKTIATILALFQ